MVFDGAASVGQTLDLVVIINGKTVSHSLSVVMKSKYISSFVMSPSSASPVLKTNITFTLDADFDDIELVKTDFSLNATNLTNPYYVRYLAIVEVDNESRPRSFKAIFGGAWSGQYQIHLSHKDLGMLDTRGLVLDVNTNITSFSPMFGSVYGGTLLTIDGVNFGN